MSRPSEKLIAIFSTSLSEVSEARELEPFRRFRAGLALNQIALRAPNFSLFEHRGETEKREFQTYTAVPIVAERSRPVADAAAHTVRKMASTHTDGVIFARVTLGEHVDHATRTTRNRCVAWVRERVPVGVLENFTECGTRSPVGSAAHVRHGGLSTFSIRS